MHGKITKTETKHSLNSKTEEAKSRAKVRKQRISLHKFHNDLAVITAVMQGRQLNSNIYHTDSTRSSMICIYSVYSKLAEHTLFGVSEHRLFAYDVSGDSDCYLVFHARKLWDMFNEVFREHQQTSP